MSCLEERHHWRWPDQHRGFCVPRLQRLAFHDDSRRSGKHRPLCILGLHRPEAHNDSRQRKTIRIRAVSRLHLHSLSQQCLGECRWPVVGVCRAERHGHGDGRPKRRGGDHPVHFGGLSRDGHRGLRISRMHCADERGDWCRSDKYRGHSVLWL